MKNLKFLDESLEDNAANNPKKQCLIFEEEFYTYEDIINIVNKTGNFFQKRGIKKGDRVLICLLNCPELVISLYALSKIGAIAVPINYWLGQEEADYILKDSSASLIITDSDKLNDFLSIKDSQTPVVVADTSGDLTHQQLFYFWDAIPKEEDVLQALEERSMDDVAHILYTSGTTGRPKGVMLTHESVMFCSSLFTYNEDMEDDRGPVYSKESLCISALPLYHCFGLNVTLISPIAAGGTVILIKRFSPDKVLEAITHHKANIFAGVPTMYAYMAQVYNQDEHDLSSTRFSCSAGAALPEELIKEFKEKTGVRIIQGYGITEASAQTIAPPLRIDTSVQKAGTIGLPLRNKEESTEAEIFDDNDREQPPNELGELVIKGRHVMKGYWGMPEETNNTIRNGWLHTGDLAKKDEDGYLYIVDRKKDLIIVGGENVVPKEVEEVLYKNSNILEAAVVGVPDSLKGEVIKAVVALKKGAQITEEHIKDYCTQRLAKFKVPQFVEFYEELPKSATGKILRKELKK